MPRGIVMIVEQGLFDESAPIRRVAGEGLLIAGGGRATVLQNAHPLIARGTADHSGFAARPLDRLHNTVRYLYTVVFGTREQAEKIAQAVATMHERITGPGYAAGDPALQVWVAATLYDTAILLYESAFGPLPAADAELCYQQYSVMATAIGCPERAWPASRQAFADYWAGMVADMRVTDTSRRIAHALLFPADLPLALRPAVPLHRFLTVGLLPPPIRERLGYSWTPRQERLLRHGLRLVGTVYPLLPRPLRHAPMTRYVRPGHRSSVPAASTLRTSSASSSRTCATKR